MSYSIITYCSENYKKLLKPFIDCVIENSYCSKLFIYTNFNLDTYTNTNRIIIKKIIDNDDDNKSLHYQQKAISLLDAATNSMADDNIILLDLDCLVKENLSSLFMSDFDIAVTIPDSANYKKPYNNVSSGFVAIKKSLTSERFIQKWIEEQNRLRRSVVADQAALSAVLSEYYINNFANILPLRELEYNCYPKYNKVDSIFDWLTEMKYNTNAVKVIHMAYGLWNNQNLVLQIQKEILNNGRTTMV